jgi:hypothetical protein
LVDIDKEKELGAVGRSVVDPSCVLNEWKSLAELQ